MDTGELMLGVEVIASINPSINHSFSCSETPGQFISCSKLFILYEKCCFDELLVSRKDFTTIVTGFVFQVSSETTLRICHL